MANDYQAAAIAQYLRRVLTPARFKEREIYAGKYASKRQMIIMGAVLVTMPIFIGIASCFPPVGVVAGVGGGGTCIASSLGLGEVGYSTALQEGAKQWDMLNGFADLYG